MSWRKYVEMRRGLSSSDGRSRSKGQPQISKKKNGTDIARGRRSFLRGTEHVAPTREKLLAKKKPEEGEAKTKVKQQKLPQENRWQRVAQKFKKAASHAAKMVKLPRKAEEAQKIEPGKEAQKTNQADKTAKQAKPKKPRPSSPARAAKHGVKQQNVDAAKQTELVKTKTKTETKTKQPAPQPAPPQPAPRRR